jgi:hypothetical protein
MSLHTVSPDVPFASAPPDPEVALSSRATSAGFRPVPSKPFSTSAARSCATVILLAVMAQTRVFETGHTHNHTRVLTQTVRPSNASVVVCTCPGVDSNKRQIHFPESRRLQRRPERKLLTIFRKSRTRGAEARHQGMNVQVSIRRRDMLTTAFFTGCPGDLPCPLSAVSGKCSTGAKTSKQRGRLGRSLSRTRARPQHGSPKRPVFERNLRGVGAGGGGCVVLFGACPSFSASASWFLAREFGANFGEDAKTSPRA